MVTCLCVSMALPYLLFFLLPFFSSAVFSPADNYLLSCGSITNTTLSDGSDTRSFIPDTSSSSKLSISIDGSISFTSPDITRNSTSDLYRTTRFFSKQSSYTFQISKQGTHVVRLHFYPFSTPTHDLFSSVFDVSASDFPLLTSFSVRSTSDPLVVKEFYLSINITYFTLSFSPSGFVNAIEVFSAPDDLVQDTVMLVVPMAENRTLDGVSGQVLETVYRINVGGEKVAPVNDSLWRTWIPDWDFLRTKTLAMPVPFARVAYQQGFGPSVEIAPMLVYGTAREMNKSGNSSSSNSNLIWGFPVSSNQRYLVRMHFCDIVSPALNDLYFNTYINNHSVMTDLDLSTQTTLQLRAPFYSDSIVDTNGVSQLVVGVGPSAQTQADEKNAILNGLEIMKLNGAALLSESCPKKSNLGFVVSVVVGSLVVVGIVVLLLMLVLCTRTWKKDKKLPPEGSLWVMVPGNSSLGGRTTVNSPLPDLNLNLRIPFADILLATNNFDRENEIGAGGFGKVYKGVLKDGMKVAVKRASRGASQGMAEFYTEVMVLSKIRHRHLVPLIGYCEERGEMILVYEFMEKGTLRSHLYGPDKSTRPDLSWKQRLQMCIGSARGLHYLHTGSASQGVIHRDVKSANILLNENWVAKVADFGLSKLGPLLNQTHVSTTVKGSFGYLDPEYFRTQQLTDKSDVYSFGVVLLEVLCARGAIDRSLPYEQQNLAEWGLKKLQEGEIEQIVDPALHGSINPNSLRKYGEIIEKCLEKYGVDRPTMGDVLWNLEYALKLQEIEMQDEPNEDNGLSSVSSEVAPGVYAVRSGLPAPNHQQGTISSMEVDRRETRPTNPSEDSQVSNSQAFSQLITRRGR